MAPVSLLCQSSLKMQNLGSVHVGTNQWHPRAKPWLSWALSVWFKSHLIMHYDSKNKATVQMVLIISEGRHSKTSLGSSAVTPTVNSFSWWSECFSVCLLSLELSVCVCLGVLCALSRDRLLWQGWATGSSAQQVQQGVSTLLQSSRKKLWQTWSGFSFSLEGSRGLYIQTLHIQHLACLCLCFFKKSEILFLGKPTVSYRRYWDIKPKALHNVQIYLSNKGGVVGKEKENTSIWQLTSYSQMWRW